MPIVPYRYSEAITRGADMTVCIEIEVDPDTNEPKTIKQLAQEQRDFIADEETLGRVWLTVEEDEAWKDL